MCRMKRCASSSCSKRYRRWENQQNKHTTTAAAVQASSEVVRSKTHLCVAQLTTPQHLAGHRVPPPIVSLGTRPLTAAGGKKRYTRLCLLVTHKPDRQERSKLRGAQRHHLSTNYRASDSLQLSVAEAEGAQAHLPTAWRLASCLAACLQGWRRLLKQVVPGPSHLLMGPQLRTAPFPTHAPYKHVQCATAPPPPHRCPSKSSPRYGIPTCTPR